MPKNRIGELLLGLLRLHLYTFVMCSLCHCGRGAGKYHPVDTEKLIALISCYLWLGKLWLGKTLGFAVIGLVLLSETYSDANAQASKDQPSSFSISQSRPEQPAPVLLPIRHSRWQQILRREVLVVQMRSSNPPLTQNGVDRVLVGFEVDLAKAIAEQLGLDVQLVHHTPKLVSEMIIHPCCDVTMAGIGAISSYNDLASLTTVMPSDTSLNEEVVNDDVRMRRHDSLDDSILENPVAPAQIQMTAPYSYIPFYMMLAERDSFSEWTELNEQRIAYSPFDGTALWLIQERMWSWQYDGIEPLLKPPQDSIGVEFANSVVALDELAAGAQGLSGVVVGMPMRDAAIDAGIGLNFWPQALFIKPVVAVYRKQDFIFGQKVNEVLQQLRDDGILSQLSEKWFATDLTIYSQMSLQSDNL